MWHQPCQCPQLNNVVTTSVDIQNMLCKITVTHLELHRARVQWVCPEAENNTIVAIVKCLGLILTCSISVPTK